MFLSRIDGLKQLPAITRRYARLAADKIAKGNLQWKFGIAPMIGDVTRLLKFSDVVNRRMIYLRKIRDGKELRRNVTLGSDDFVQIQKNVSLDTSTGRTFRGTKYTSYSYKEWASCRWLATSSTPQIPEDDSALRYLAVRNAYGLNSRGALEAAYELTPWSWLMDWYSNIGDFLQATNNSLGLVPGSMCVMRHSTGRQVSRFTDVPPNLTISGLDERTYERKERRVIDSPVAFPMATLPVLTTGQWSILGSLTYLRTRKGRK